VDVGDTSQATVAKALKKVFAIAFLSLVDGLEPIHSRRERRAR
jgi:hypothetical protein